MCEKVETTVLASANDSNKLKRAKVWLRQRVTGSAHEQAPKQQTSNECPVHASGITLLASATGKDRACWVLWYWHLSWLFDMYIL